MNPRIDRHDFLHHTADLARAAIALPLTSGAAETPVERSAVVIGFKRTAEIDESLERMNRALREFA